MTKRGLAVPGSHELAAICSRVFTQPARGVGANGGDGERQQLLVR